jgi:TetR/AcrR family transcriptional repressor of lmrAB and yxaGH operons
MEAVGVLIGLQKPAECEERRMATDGPRARLIRSAIALVRERGVEATGLTELTAHSGAARRSIYQHFAGGKNELIETSTRAAGRWMARVLDSAEGGSPRELGALLVARTAENLRASDFRSGCPIGAAALAPPEMAGVRSAAAEAFELWTDKIAAVLAAAGMEPREARSVAGFAISAIEGALLRAIAARSTEPLEQVGEQLVRLLPE